MVLEEGDKVIVGELLGKYSRYKGKNKYYVVDFGETFGIVEISSICDGSLGSYIFMNKVLDCSYEELCHNRASGKVELEYSYRVLLGEEDEYNINKVLIKEDDGYSIVRYNG